MSGIADRRSGFVSPGEKNKRGPGPYHIDTFIECPQKAAFNYEMRIEPAFDPKREPAEIGTIVHTGLAYLYASRLPQRPAWMVYNSPEEAMALQGAARPDLVHEATRIFAWYRHYYQNVDIWRPVLIEHQFQAQLGPDDYMTARIDMLAWEGPDLCVIDHKVKGKIGPRTGLYAATDRQMLTILALTRQAGYEVTRVILNCMTRDYPQPRFERYDVPVNPEAYKRFGTDAAYWLRRRNEVRKLFPDPTNRPRNYNACMSKFGLCPYDPLCRDGIHRLGEYVKK